MHPMIWKDILQKSIQSLLHLPAGYQAGKYLHISVLPEKVLQMSYAILFLPDLQFPVLNLLHKELGSNDVGMSDADAPYDLEGYITEIDTVTSTSPRWISSRKIFAYFCSS